MKKLVSLAAAAVLAAAPVVSGSAFAEDAYVPMFYIKAQSGCNVTPEGDVVLSRKELADSADGVVLKMDVFIEDDFLASWYLGPKWKCANKFVRLTTMYDPLESGNFTEYAYAEKNADGKLICKYNTTMVSVDEECNTMNYTCMRTLSLSSIGDDKPLVPYGEKSDDYPLISFDVTVDAAAPADVYDIYFLTKAEDYADQQFSTIHTVAKDGVPAQKLFPRVKGLSVIVTDDGKFCSGDVNSDDAVDASDASLALAEYAAIQTTGQSSLTPVKAKAADVNRDGAVDAGDASLILGFYSHQQTSESSISSISEWMKLL